MRATPLLVCLWPGLAGLWLRGRGSGLLTALAFAALLNFALAASFVLPELGGSVLVPGAWAAVGVLWIAGLWRNARQLPGLLAPPPAPQPEVDLFPKAQAEYLKGHWFEAESLLARQLQSFPEDAESRLMLATLMRRNGRVEEARKELRRLERCEGATRWRLEIAEQRRQLDRREQRDEKTERLAKEQTHNPTPHSIRQRNPEEEQKSRQEPGAEERSGAEPTRGDNSQHSAKAA